MFSLAHLDRFSLTLCVNGNSVLPDRHFKDKEGVSEVFERAVNNDDKGVIDIINYSTGEQKIERSLVASLVWHERRHFADFLLTNYSSYYTRI